MRYPRQKRTVRRYLAVVAERGEPYDMGLVLESRRNRAPDHPLHYVVPSKECVVELLAENVDVFRVAGTPREAAVSSLSPEPRKG